MPRILHGSFDERALRIRVYDVRITPLGDYAHIWRVPISVRSTTTNAVLLVRRPNGRGTAGCAWRSAPTAA
jgi:hypothetical protein